MATVAAPRRGGWPGWPGRPGQLRFGSPRPPRTPRLASLQARTRGSWLDRELAAGVAPWTTAVHSARSVQITSRRGRCALAASVEALIQRARTPGPAWGLTAQVPVDRAAVLGARPYLEAIVIRLRDGQPVSTMAVAALRDLMTDGAGPIYSPLTGQGLGRVAASIRDLLDVPE